MIKFWKLAKIEDNEELSKKASENEVDKNKQKIEVIKLEENKCEVERDNCSLTSTNGNVCDKITEQCIEREQCNHRDMCEACSNECKEDIDEKSIEAERNRI